MDPALRRDDPSRRGGQRSAPGPSDSGQRDGEARLLRTAALLHLFPGLAFGASIPSVLSHLERTGELPMTFGFRSMAGPFERLGPATFTTLGWGLVVVCALDVLASVFLWRRRRIGAWLALATAPIAFGLATGFALPILLVGVPIRAALVVAGRRSLS